MSVYTSAFYNSRMCSDVIFNFCQKHSHIKKVSLRFELSPTPLSSYIQVDAALEERRKNKIKKNGTNRERSCASLYTLIT